jgi:hypothetical protein
MIVKGVWGRCLVHGRLKGRARWDGNWWRRRTIMKGRRRTRHGERRTGELYGSRRWRLGKLTRDRDISPGHA